MIAPTSCKAYMLDKTNFDFFKDYYKYLMVPTGKL